MDINTAVIIAVLIVLIFVYTFWSPMAEAFSEIVYLDQMAMKNSDPMYFKYSSWERDVDGMSPRDYYLENQTNYLNQVAPGYFKGNGLYRDHTDYLNMPKQYRPVTNDMAPLSAAAPEIMSRRGQAESVETSVMNGVFEEGVY
jgi:hypothetical protein